MTTSIVDRFQLNHGPYLAPRVWMGQNVTCEIYGSSRVIGISQGRIAWPLVRAPKGGRPVPALVSDLIEAVMRESKQAVAHWWGVSEKTVWRWRCALGVPEHNDGTLRLRRDYAEITLHTDAAKANAAESVRSPRRRAETSARLRGRSRPPEVIDKMRASLKGRKVDAEWRERLSEGKRRASCMHPANGRAWTVAEDDLVRQLPAQRAAMLVGRSLRAVLDRRRMLAAQGATAGVNGNGMPKPENVGCLCAN